jgi:uncharacterized membrane protein HdeD (DUF308 family)
MDMLSRTWWLLALRGLVGLVFGVLFLAWPTASFAGLVLAFGVWALVDGLFALGAALSGRRGGDAALEGVVGVAIGVVTFARPAVTGAALYLVIAGWAVATGVLRVVAALRLRREIEGEIWLGLSGLASLGFGVLLVMLPAAGVLAIGWMIGVYAIVLGALLIALSVRVRRLVARPHAF